MPDAPATTTQYPWDATTQAIVQALQQSQPQAQPVQPSAPFSLQQQAPEEQPVQLPPAYTSPPQVPQVQQQQLRGDTPKAAPLPPMEPVKVPPISQVDVARLLQWVGPNQAVEQARAKIVHALLNPTRSAVIAPPIR